MPPSQAFCGRSVFLATRLDVDASWATKTGRAEGGARIAFPPNPKGFAYSFPLGKKKNPFPTNSWRGRLCVNLVFPLFRTQFHFPFVLHLRPGNVGAIKIGAEVFLSRVLFEQPVKVGVPPKMFFDRPPFFFPFPCSGILCRYMRTAVRYPFVKTGLASVQQD